MKNEPPVAKKILRRSIHADSHQNAAIRRRPWAMRLKTAAIQVGCSHRIPQYQLEIELEYDETLTSFVDLLNDYFFSTWLM
jgi:hypothetical protein